MEILLLGNETLKQKAAPIKNITAETAKIAGNLIDIMHKGKGIGLAGPQVGIMEKIFVIHVNGDEPRVFINPSILETSEETSKYEEGCLSIPGVWADVIRPENIKLQAWNEKGRPFTLEASGILARAILHEYDHLEGVLFIDRLSEPKRNRVIAKYEKRWAFKNSKAVG
ncbi:MAG: peptide deformylase [Treponema sp.]|jgi:peptide deformylase|nr:peptide deformylase [Treponema sp.]